MKDINIVLVNPEIPQNTGNISRTCAVTGAALHIIRPTGFEISDRTLKRAGLDYWQYLDVTYYDSFEEFLSLYGEEEIYYFTSHTEKSSFDVKYGKRVFLVFGKESVGLDPELVEKNRDRAVRIPMAEGVRCLNLSNSAAIAVYEVLRQRGFLGLV